MFPNHFIHSLAVIFALKSFRHIAIHAFGHFKAVGLGPGLEWGEGERVEREGVARDGGGEGRDGGGGCACKNRFL